MREDAWFGGKRTHPIVASVKMGGEVALSELMGTWRNLFRNELKALRLQKRTGNPEDGPVLFRYGPLVEVAASLSLKEKQEMLETLAKGWTRVSDKGTWVNDWTLEQIELAGVACDGALTLIKAKRMKLEYHADEAGCTEQAEAMESYIEDTLSQMEDAIVESVLPRLRDGKALLLSHLAHGEE